MFSTTTQPVQGVAAVAALKLASQQGQRIYHITPQNQASTLPNLHLDGLAVQEIQQGLATGKEVIAHTDRISIPGFTGEGYIIFDPTTGGGGTSKLQLFFVAVIVGFLSMLGGIMFLQESPVSFIFVLAGLSCGIGAFIFASLAIRCPSCGAHWFWYAVSKKRTNDWVLSLLKDEKCVVCGMSKWR